MGTLAYSSQYCRCQSDQGHVCGSKVGGGGVENQVVHEEGQIGRQREACDAGDEGEYLLLRRFNSRKLELQPA